MSFKRYVPRVKEWTAPELPGPRVPLPAELRIPDGKARMIISLPKRVYLRSEPYRRWVASLDCAHCGRGGPSQAAHSDAGSDGKGMGLKACDSAIFAACADRPAAIGCHSMLGATGMFTRWQQQRLADGYIEQTQRRAIAEGKWPKDWPMPELEETT